MAREIAKCPSCDAPISESYRYFWCLKCANPLPESVTKLLPYLDPSILPPPIKEGSSRKLTPYKSTYRTARVIAQLISVIGWLGVVIGGVLVVGALFEGRSAITLLLLPGLGLALGGFVLVGGGQLTRAAVDTADHTGEMLAIMQMPQSPFDRQAPKP